MSVLEGRCHCGAAGWRFDGDTGPVTACNCTLCHRYGSLWVYDYEGGRIEVTGPTATYRRADTDDPALEIHFCPICASVVSWRGLRVDEEGRRRVAVNVRMARHDLVAHLPIDHFDGLDQFEDLPPDGRCVRDMWF